MVQEYHQYKKLFLNQIVLKEQHNIEKKIDLVRYFNPKFIDTTMSISDNYYHQAPVDYLPTKKKIIGIQLGAQDVYKIWPVENVIKLSLYLVKKNYFLVFSHSCDNRFQFMNRSILSFINN